MTDTPESSEHINVEETSIVEEGLHLVDTVDDPAPSWVGPEPRGIFSVYSYRRRKAYTVVEHGSDMEGFCRNFTILRPTPTERICTEFEEDHFPMYEVVFKDSGLRFPFNDFQMGVLNHLNLAPSQLYPNSIAFLRAFEITCRFLRIGATICFSGFSTSNRNLGVANIVGFP